MRRTAWETEPCVSNNTSMISFADPGPGGINPRTARTSQFGGLRPVSLGVGPCVCVLRASISIEVSPEKLLPAGLLEKIGHTYRLRAIGGARPAHDWSQSVVHLC